MQQAHRHFPLPRNPDEQVYSAASLQVQPEFPGGINEFYDYIIKSLVEKKVKATGKIFISFVVEKDGMVSDIRVLKGGDDAVNEQIRQILLKSPKWTPGKQNDKPVRTTYRLPLSFN